MVGTNNVAEKWVQCSLFLYSMPRNRKNSQGDELFRLEGELMLKLLPIQIIKRATSLYQFQMRRA